MVGLLKGLCTLESDASLGENRMMCTGGVGLDNVIGPECGWCLGVIGVIILGSVGTFVVAEQVAVLVS